MAIPGETYDDKLDNLIIFKDAMININQSLVGISDRDKRMVISVNLNIYLEIFLSVLTSELDSKSKEIPGVARDFRPLVEEIRRQARIISNSISDIPAGGVVHPHPAP